MSLTIDNKLSQSEANQWAEFQALSDDEKAERLWREDQERSIQTYVANSTQTEQMNDLAVSYDSNGKLENGKVTKDSIITLAKSGFQARAESLVTAGVIPASAIGMPYDQFIKEHG